MRMRKMRMRRRRKKRTRRTRRRKRRATGKATILTCVGDICTHFKGNNKPRALPPLHSEGVFLSG